MADLDQRALERLWESGDTSVLPRLNRMRRRMGLSILRSKIVHYIKAHYHHRLFPDGTVDPRVSNRPVHSACGTTEVWPRTYYSKRSRYAKYTPNKDMVTCKTCVRCLNSPNFEDGKPLLHMSLKTLKGVRPVCGGGSGQSTEILEEVGCRGCLRMLRGEPRTRSAPRLNARGRRRLRRQTMFAFQT